jgi:hypothetical protein
MNSRLVWLIFPSVFALVAISLGFLSPISTQRDLAQWALQSSLTPREVVFDLATAYRKSEVLYMLTHHKVFDAIGNQGHAKTCRQVAFDVGLQEHILCEYMKAGHHLGLFQTKGINDSREYFLTEAGKLLQYKTAGSMRDITIFLNEATREAWRASGTVSARTGKSGWEEAFGAEPAVWYEKNPREVGLFQSASQFINEEETDAFLSAWKPMKEDAVFCDIGGARGETLARVLHRYSEMKGIILDKTHFGLGSMQLLEETLLTKRATFVGGFLFAPSLPKKLEECNVLFMKHILDQFDDESCISVLSKAKKVASKGAKLVIVERILGMEGPPAEAAKSLESIHLIASGASLAKVRSLDELTMLLSTAGYTTKPKLVHSPSPLSVLEIDVT